MGGAPESWAAPADSIYHPEVLTAALTLLALVPGATRPPAAARLSPPDPALAPVGAWELLVASSWRPATMQVLQRTSTPTAGDVLASARRYLGTPYEWGGNNDGGFDCSGFTNKVYADNGYDIPRGGADQMLVGDPVPFAALAAGDLVFFSRDPGGAIVSHVALYAGDGEIIHAAAGKGEVTYDRIAALYYRSRFLGARRLLTHPPGSYAAADGAAPPMQGEPPLDALVRTALADDERPGAPGAGPPEGAAGAPEWLERRPPQLAPFSALAWPPRSGPASLRAEATSVGVRLGVGRLDGSSGVLAAVEASYFDHEDALALTLAAPFELPFSGEPREGGCTGYETARDYSRILQEARFGQPGADLYVELGRTASASLGQGQLVRSLTPSIAGRAVPDYALFADHLSLVASGRAGGGGGQVLVDDVFAPRVLAAAVTARPFALAGTPDGALADAAITLGWATDLAAPGVLAADGTRERRAVHGVSLGVELDPVHRRGLEVTSYAEAATLVHTGQGAVGGALGGLLRATLAARHAFRLRLEAGVGSPGYLPGYFDAMYALDRSATPLARGEPRTLPKLEVSDALAGGSGRWSVLVDAGYQLQRRFGIGITYADGGPLGATGLPGYESRDLFVYLELHDLYLPATSRSLSLYLAYHRHGFDSLTPLFSSSGAHEYLFAAARLRSSRHVSLGASLRRALDPRSGVAAFEGVLDVAVGYEP